MLVGVPREIKPAENRVSITPSGVAALRREGHRVLVEEGAGNGSGFTDEEYLNAGAELTPEHGEVFRRAEMVVKVKEPVAEEYELLCPEQILFTYLHLAAEPELASALLRRRVTAVAYETVTGPDGSLPLLTPMSEVAGRMATQVGAWLLEKHQGGRGILLGGVPGVSPADVVILGGGVVGTNAAKMAVGLGAHVIILEINPERMRYLDDIFGGRVTTLTADHFTIADAVRQADLLIGAVLIPGARAPRLVTEDMVRTMKPGAVIVDVAIDQGGSVETCDRVTTHEKPTYLKHGVVHYSVGNMPGAVPRTSTLALTSVTLRYVLKLAGGFRRSVEGDPGLAAGVNTHDGHLTHPAVAAALGLPYRPLEFATLVPR